MLTRIVTFFLRPEDGHHEHTGSFGSGLRTTGVGGHLLDDVDVRVMYGRVDQFVARSSVLCTGAIELHVVHNLQVGNVLTSTRRYVTYHADPPDGRRGLMPAMPTIDRRFWLLQRLLQRAGAAWECVFSVDLTDVDILRAPRCDTLPRGHLAIASDSCGPGVKRWVRVKGEDAGFNSTWTPGFRAFLSGQSGGERAPPRAHTCVCNCGIVGGRRAVVLRALRYVVARLAEVWRQPIGALRLSSHRLRDPVGDMVAWNEYCFAHANEIVTGYPSGPVNLPMYGHLHVGTAPTSVPAKCTDECLHAWHNASVGAYFFGHKLPGWVRWLHLPRACRVVSPSMALAATRAAWRSRGKHRPLQNCTLPQCVRASYN